MDRAACVVHQLRIAIAAVSAIVPRPMIKPAPMAANIETAPHVSGRSHPTDMKTVGTKAVTEAIDAPATPDCSGEIKARIAMWGRNAGAMSNRPVIIPATLNFVEIPTSLLLSEFAMGLETSPAYG